MSECELIKVGNDEYYYYKVCYKKFYSSDECLYIENQFMWMHHKRSIACNKRVKLKSVKIIYLLFVKIVK